MHPFSIALVFLVHMLTDIGLILVLLILFSILFFTKRKTKEQLNAQQKTIQMNALLNDLELTALRAKMNPHFIFNSLNSIQDFILNNQAIESGRYLSKFARLIRMILDNSEQPFIQISQKIEFINLYVELESLRLSKCFEFDLSVDQSVNLQDEIPYMIIQPFIENAIWHGLQQKLGSKKLSIYFYQEETDFITCIVQDNGVGRGQALQVKNTSSDSHQSKAIHIIHERIAILKKVFGFGPNIDILDLKDENGNALGTKVSIKLPIKKDSDANESHSSRR